MRKKVSVFRKRYKMCRVVGMPRKAAFVLCCIAITKPQLYGLTMVAIAKSRQA